MTAQTVTLVDLDKLRLVKKLPSTEAAEYWADLVLHQANYIILDCTKRALATFSALELRMLYDNHSVKKMPDSVQDYTSLVQAVAGIVEDMPVDDTDVPALRKKLRREPAPPTIGTQGTHAVAAPAQPAGRPWEAAPTAAKPHSTPAARAAGPVTRPRGGATATVWDVCDQLYAMPEYSTAKESAAIMKELRSAAIDTCVEKGVNKSTASVQFGKWKSSI